MPGDGSVSGGDFDAERAWRAAAAAGDSDASYELGWLLAQQPGREREAEAALRAAIAAGDDHGWWILGWLLAKQRGREAEAEAALREAVAAGHEGSGLHLGRLLMKQRDRDAEAQAAFRGATTSPDPQIASSAAYGLGFLLDAQGDFDGARGAYEIVLERGSGRTRERASAHLGWLLGYRGDRAGARAAFEAAARAAAERIDHKQGVDVRDLVPRIARGLAAVSHNRLTRTPIRALRVVSYRARRTARSSGRVQPR